MYKLYTEDILKWTQEYDGDRFHACLCDPPYHLTSIVKRFGKTSIDDDTLTSDKVRNGVDGYSRLIRTGFMGQTWDGGDVAFQPETWSAIGNCLFPGAYLLAFGGTRTFHRLACAIEDAGFEIRDTVMWLYGSGFPKSHNLHGVFEGYGTALKPAFEPIVVARKPIEGTVANNCMKYGSGAINIDGCLVPTEENIPINKLEEWSGFGQKIRPDYEQRINNKGRWPANLVHDGSEEVTAEFPNTASGKMLSTHKRHTDGSPNGIYGKFDINAPLSETIGDNGSAARFFYCAKVSPAERNAGLEKNNHPTLKPIALTEYLAKLILPPLEYSPRRILIPFCGAGSEAIGAYRVGWEEIVGIELSPEYTEIAEARLKHWTSIPKQMEFNNALLSKTATQSK